MMRLGSRPESPGEVSPCDSCRYNTVLGNAVGLTVFGLARNFDSGTAPHVCVVDGHDAVVWRAAFVFSALCSSLAQRGKEIRGAADISL